MVRVTFLKLECGSSGIVQTHMVGGIHCHADQPIGCRIVVKSWTDSQQDCQDATKHAFMIRTRTGKKNPRELPRGGRWDGGGNLHTLL
jgi:hypothetical protein